MSSHRLDQIRRPRLVELKIPSQDVQSSTSPESAIFDSPIVAPSRSQIPRPANASTQRTRGPSSGACEDEQPVIRPYAKSSRSLSNNDARPSGLPRPAGNSSSHLPLQRPSASSATTSRAVLSSAPPVTPVTPKADRLGLSGDRPRNVLRRKPPFRNQNGDFKVATSGSRMVEDTKPAATSASSIATSGHSEQSVGHVSGSAQGPSQSRPADPPSAMASKLPRTKTPKAIEESSTRQILKELAGLSTVINTHNLPPPPTPNFASAGSPSTRYSESPGMWSSRGSTPTSLSSYSPGIVQPAKIGYRLRQPSPTQVRQPIISRASTNSPQAERQDHRILGSQTSSGIPDSTIEQGKLDHVSGTSSHPEPSKSPPPRKLSVESKSPKQQDNDDDERQKAHEIHAVEDAERRVVGSALPHEVTTGQSPTSKSPVAPRRPSRQGTDNLELKPSPIIQSNLTTLRTTGHTRRESAEKLLPGERPRLLPVSSAGASVESLQSSASSRIASRSELPPQLPKRPARTLTKSPKTSKDAVGMSSAKRFGLFSKKSKVDLAGGNSSQPDKPTRRGPAAGTGHEGYGKYAHRGRRTSIGSNGGTRARSTSTTRSGGSKGNVKGRPELEIDDFLLERLEPVIINGGGMDQAELVRTQSGQSVSKSNLSVTSASASPTSNEMTPLSGYSSESLVSSTEHFGQPPRFLRSDSHLPSQVETSQEGKPALVKDRSFQSPRKLESDTVEKSSTFQDAENPESRTASNSSAEPSFSALPPISAKEGLNSEAVDKTKPDKRGKGMMWNFFHRTNSADRKVSSPASASHPTAQLQATIVPVSNNRPVAHYALLDADSDSLEEILHRVEESPPTEEETELPSKTTEGSDLKKPHGSSVLLPPPPALWAEYSSSREVRPASPKVFFHKDTKEDSIQPGHPRPRLASVGRIPRVVSRRDGDHKPVAQSFSRPFSRDEAPSLTITANSQPDVHYLRPPLGIKTDVLPSKPFRSEPDTPKASIPPALNEGMKFASGAYASNEFLQFSPRVSSSTGSEDIVLAAVTAVGPRPDLRPTEDEVWSEYDDLLDSVLLPESRVSRHQAEPDAGEPFEMVTKASKTLQAELNASSDKATVPDVPDTPAVVPPPTFARSSDGSTRLRRSKIVSALHSSMSPSPQVSYSELIAGYGERNKSSHDSANLDNPLVSTQADNPSVDPESSTPANAPDFESTRRHNTMLFDIAERDREGAVAQTNLRSASLMTSRWLSFGRVLFSPAHNRIKSGDEERILVIDGLGNDDWSYYCALTYPNAIVYSLSTRPMSSTSAHPAAWQPPENHHLIHHTSIDAPFPFPKGFFAVCILRFPAACSEYGQRNIISECKRVLRPGGYLEMSILDLDLVNMGNRARKAVRMLKERIYLADPNISLKPASDNIQRLLGVCGFDNLNRCMVSVPVSGTIVGSSDSSNSNRSASNATPAASTGQSNSAPATESQSRQRKSSDDAERSLGDLLSDPSPSASNDESIAKMVARVGRWWYTRCYEIPVLSDGALDRSIWADKKLLRECQKRGTGFRLLIAYAQKPNEKRRTASV
ncbi:hypothetical protein VTN77DRAFT_377 [Rasamsonia byssochlamydoides]|uniref:uncharacterized protein n=1 Tax=Rasamsonia byssochlamydoides TaxID=89139 RepID=UPI00374432E8